MYSCKTLAQQGEGGTVVNECGHIQGLVIVENILEEIVVDFTNSILPTLLKEIKLTERRLDID
jgi:Mg2+/Co2+ transporter CorB